MMGSGNLKNMSLFDQDDLNCREELSEQSPIKGNMSNSINMSMILERLKKFEELEKEV